MKYFLILTVVVFSFSSWGNDSFSMAINGNLFVGTASSIAGASKLRLKIDIVFKTSPANPSKYYV